MLTDLLIASLGLALVAVVLSDFVRTTLQLRGSGVLSTIIMRGTWRAMQFLQDRIPGSGILVGAGTTMLLVNIVAWASLLWLGWLLVFLPFPQAVESTATAAPADLWSRAYFVGYSLITLGVGDYAPTGPFFQVATVVSAMSGFFLMTLAVTYLVPVVSAVIQERQLAAQILLLGGTPARLAEIAADEGARQQFEQEASSLTAPLLLAAERLYAYPVLNYYRSSHRDTSLGVALAVLDEALTVLLLAPQTRQSSLAGRLAPIRKTIGFYLQSRLIKGDASDQPVPPAPSLEPLRRAGVATVATEEFERKLDTIGSRRQQLAMLLRLEGREWSEVADFDMTSSEGSVDD